MLVQAHWRRIEIAAMATVDDWISCVVASGVMAGRASAFALVRGHEQFD